MGKVLQIGSLDYDAYEPPDRAYVRKKLLEALKYNFLTIKSITICLLACAFIGSCIAVLIANYQHRELLIDYQHLNQTQTDLEVEWTQILLEHSTLASPVLVDRKARDTLHMIHPEPENVRQLRAPAL